MPTPNEKLAELLDADGLRLTCTDLVIPDNWVVTTEAGRKALEMGALEGLDAAPENLDPHLIGAVPGDLVGP